MYTSWSELIGQAADNVFRTLLHSLGLRICLEFEERKRLLCVDDLEDIPINRLITLIGNNCNIGMVF